MATPKKRTKQQILAELMELARTEKVEHEARIVRVGTLIFPPPPDLPLAPEKDTDPHVILIGIDELLHAKKPLEALDKLIEIATAKRDKLAARTKKKTSPATHLKNVVEETPVVQEKTEVSPDLFPEVTLPDEGLRENVAER